MAIHQINAISNILVFQMGSMLGCLLLSDCFIDLTPRTQISCWGPKEIVFLFYG